MPSPIITDYQAELASLEAIQDHVFVIGATEPAKNLDRLQIIASYAEENAKKFAEKYPDLSAIAAYIGYNAFRLLEAYDNKITEGTARALIKRRNAMWSVVKRHDEASKSRQQG
ncbi:hypothetical protein KC960_04585 [Candidatus Saccharibacteria bacterium]|nr:hypothetical protein [Candidatus Saccharibacteria bacterium]